MSCFSGLFASNTLEKWAGEY